MKKDKVSKKSNLDIYWFIIFFIFFLVNMLKNYFGYIKILKPLILELTLILVFIYEIGSKCNFEELPIVKITNRSLILLAIYLYCESTVKCIPIFSLTINNLFKYPLLGDIIKSTLAYLLTFGFNYILNLYNVNYNENLDPLVCNIKNSSNNIILSLTILVIIIINSYLEYL